MSGFQKTLVACGSGCGLVAIVALIVVLIVGRSAANLSTTATVTVSSKPHPMGTKVAIPETIGGIDSVQVNGWYTNVSSSNQYESPSSGTTWDAIDVTACAGHNGTSLGVDPTDFSVLLSNGSTASSSPIVSGPLTTPQLSSLTQFGYNITSLAPNQCVRGWVVFEVPNAATPTYVQFAGSAFLQKNSVVKWTVPATK
jgi:hypothetical protein